MNYLLNTKLNVFVSILKNLFRSIIINIGLLVILCLIQSKVSYCFYVYSKTLLFFINSIKDIVNRLNPSIKHRQKLTNPRNPRISLMFIGYGQYFTISIFLSFISIVFNLILNFKQLIFQLQKIFLYILIYKLAHFNVVKMKYIYSLYFSEVLLKIKISFK